MRTVRTLDLSRDDELDLWQTYVLAHPDTQYADLGGWRRVFKALYGMRSVDLACIDGDRTVGVASLYRIASPFFGRLLVTCPFFGSGGLYADDDEARDLLLEQVDQAARELEVDFIEFRLRQRLAEPYQTHNEFLEFDMPLADDEETVFKQTLASNVRQNIRKSEQHPLVFSISSDAAEAYDLISGAIRDLGTPFHARRLFELIAEHLGEAISFANVRMEGRLIAAGLMVRFKDRISTPYIGSLKDFRHTRANYCQYWGIVRHGIETDAKVFDMGRSPRGSPHQKFKEKWGAEPVDAHYAHRTLSASRTYRTVLEPSRMETMASELWKRLPLALSQRIGPWVARHIP